MAPARYVVQYRSKTLLDPKKCLRDNCDAVLPIIQRVVHHQSGDFSKAELLIISYSERHGVLVAFDYDNSTHSECEVLGFRVGTKNSRIRRVGMPVEAIHERIRASSGRFPSLVSL